MYARMLRTVKNQYVKDTLHVTYTRKNQRLFVSRNSALPVSIAEDFGFNWEGGYTLELTTHINVRSDTASMIYKVLYWYFVSLNVRLYLQYHNPVICQPGYLSFWLFRSDPKRLQHTFCICKQLKKDVTANRYISHTMTSYVKIKYRFTNKITSSSVTIHEIQLLL